MSVVFEAFAPTHASVALQILAVLMSTLVFGFGLSRSDSPSAALRVTAWLGTLAFIVLTERLTAGEPAGFRMLAVCGAGLWSLKSVVSVEASSAGEAPLPPWRWFAFAALWPGMRPNVFAGSFEPDAEGGRRLIGRGLVRLVLGAAFILAGRLAFEHHLSLIVVSGLVLVGVSLVLHFGVFNIGAGVWRWIGADTGALFIAPLHAHSLGEFWGRRWNLAFTEMTQIAVYRPVSAKLGRNAGAGLGFLFSGALHEMAISIPVEAGHGLPMAYFVVHGALVLTERKLKSAGRPISERPVLRHVWTIGWLASPMVLLFHPPFLREVVWPLAGIRG